MILRAVLVAILALCGAGANALAHESDYSYLRLTVTGERIEGEWEIHLRDARIALGLRPDLEGEPAWAELRAQAPALRSLFAERVAFWGAEAPCALKLSDDFSERPGGREYALLRFHASCPDPVETLRIRYGLLFDLDPKHRGFFAVDDAYQTYVGVFTSAQVEVSFDVRQLDRWRQFSDYLREGIRHIWLGLDHVLFLIALLLPAPLYASAAGLVPRETFGALAREVLKVVTAFTLAHSITLSLAVLGALRLPGRWVEAAIAVSVFAAAWNNLRPFLPGRAWVLAFGFGLVHGLGFAGALSQLGLPRQAKGLALLAFNLGVETGQLAIVVLILPAMFAARRKPAYQTIVVRVGSLLIAWIAAIWLIERLLGFELIPLP